jgi:hypothetical protein
MYMDFGNLAMTFWGYVDAFYNKEGLPMDYGTSHSPWVVPHCA